MKRNLDASAMRALAHGDRSAGIGARLTPLALPLVLLGALLYVAGTWSPWLSVFTTVTGGNESGATSVGVISGSGADFTGLIAPLHLSPAADRLVFGWYGWLDVLAMVWDVLPLCGIVLAVALWLRGGQSRGLRGVYAAWLVFSSAATGAGLYGTFAVLVGDHSVGGGAPLPLTLHATVTWGVWLTLGALALGWLAFGALPQWRSPERLDGGASARAAMTHPAASDAATRERDPIAWLGASAFTVGAAIWAFGLLLVPWVTAGCTGIPISFTHFVRGKCAGLDGYDVLSAGLANGPGNPFNTTNTTISNFGLDPAHIVVALIFAGLLLAVLLWRPGPARMRVRAILAVATLWALLALLELLIGWVGTIYRLGHQQILVYGEAPQVVGPGLWLCVAGIALTLAGIGAGWLGVRPTAPTPRHPRARSAARAPHG
jgi:hypothetical protein